MALPVGEYDLRVSAPNFEEVRQTGIQHDVSPPRPIQFALKTIF